MFHSVLEMHEQLPIAFRSGYRIVCRRPVPFSPFSWFPGASSLEATFLRLPSRRGVWFGVGFAPELESKTEREETLALAVAGARVGVGRPQK